MSEPSFFSDEVSQILYNIQLDHDYTPHSKTIEDDELAKTLSFLEGGNDSVQLDKKSPSIKSSGDVQKATNISRQRRTSTKSTEKKKEKTVKGQQQPEEEIDKDYEAEIDDENSDYEISATRVSLKNVPSKAKPVKDKIPDKLKVTKPETKVIDTKSKAEVEPIKLDKLPEIQSPDLKSPDKKNFKKEKKPLKPIPDDFALFSTPDIIRRVGGKESIDSNSPDNKPAKIESRSKSAIEISHSPVKQSRPSLDGKMAEKSPTKLDSKHRDKKLTSDGGKVKVNNLDSATGLDEPVSNEPNVQNSNTTPHVGMLNVNNLDNLNLSSSDLCPGDQNMPIDGTGLDLDPSLLENINNEMISEDILYQVAQSLVSNTELQNAIDKSLNEENLALDSTIQQAIEQQPQAMPKNDTVLSQVI